MHQILILKEMTIINYQVEKQTDPSRKIQDDRNICV